MNTTHLSRRQFLQRTAAAAGGLLLSAGRLPASQVAKRTAVDQVALGKTGLKLSRLGFGTGSNSGKVQYALGREAFNSLIHYAYDQGITYFDCAEAYRTFEWIGGAIKGLPREKIFIQSKIPASRRTCSKPSIITARSSTPIMWTACSSIAWSRTAGPTNGSASWTPSTRPRRRNGFAPRAFPATACPPCEPPPPRPGPTSTSCASTRRAKHIDGTERGLEQVGRRHLPGPGELKTMRAKGRGVIGMKIIGNGDFTEPADREKSIRFAMSRPELDAVVIGFKTAEINEAIRRVNGALAEA